MRYPVRIFLGEFRHRFELPGVQAAIGDLDALHPRRVPKCARAFGVGSGIFQFSRLVAVVALAVVVTLPIGAAAEARFGEHLVVDLAMLFKLHFMIEFVDFARQRRRQGSLQPLRPNAVAGLHIP
jgi:hypothetical protein